MKRRGYLSRLVVTVLTCALLEGCSGFGTEKVERGPTLGDLGPAVLPDPDVKLPKISLEDIEQSYRRALEVAAAPEVRRKIITRLADLQMRRSEREQLAATDDKRFYDQAIEMYRELIELQRPHGDTDNLEYQLAKAYALDGRTDESGAALDRLAARYPNSPLLAETQFRRAENFFSAKKYAEAERAYQAVIDIGDQSPYYQNAVYMLGWSQFKRNHYLASLNTFTRVLDAISPVDGDFDKLRGPDRNLTQDTLRVMSLAFSYLDGAETITEVYKDLGQRPYHHQLYDRLGKLYLSKQRYRDSADTYRHYMEYNPGSDFSPVFAVRAIAVYEAGNFPSLILPAKETFVKNYGIHSQYWALKPDSLRERLRRYLHDYLPELAQFYHAQAQNYKRALARFKKTKNSGKGEYRSGGKKLSRVQLLQKERESYLTAAVWYREFVDTFPADKQTPEMLFLMAESLFDAREMPRAMEAYESVAYKYLDPVHGAEAGYSAILAADAMVQASDDGETRSSWVVRKTHVSLQFADYYVHDKRAPRVLTQTAESLLKQGRQAQAVAAAKRITDWQPALELNLRRTAWLVQGHGLFDLKVYAEAEKAYRAALALLDAKDSSRKKIEARVAASIYKAAEQLLSHNNRVGAVAQLLRVRDLVPGSDIAAKAQYDAAGYLMDMKRWQEAEKELLDFRRRFPSHKLTPTIPAKLAVIYQELEQWQLAADSMTDIYRLNPTPEAKRETLYLAAELYEKSGDLGKAILRYREYANTYAQPVDIVMEARYKLTQLYQQRGQTDKRRFWLRKLIAGEAGAGGDRTERSKYLAAYAASEMAEENYQRFLAIPLKLPLKRSLAKKKTALQETLAAYKKTLDYGVAEFTTLASYRIGEVYARLSKDLLESQRPKNLDALALEQYEILLEEQAYPFEEKAIEIHEANAQRSWDGIYDTWVKSSFQSLARLLPARYLKREHLVKYSETIY